MSPSRVCRQVNIDTPPLRCCFAAVYAVGVAVALPPLNRQRFSEVAVQLPPQPASHFEKLIGPVAFFAVVASGGSEAHNETIDLPISPRFCRQTEMSAPPW
jgi:hypothetical protein